MNPLWTGTSLNVKKAPKMYKIEANKIIRFPNVITKLISVLPIRKLLIIVAIPKSVLLFLTIVPPKLLKEGTPVY